MSVVIFDKPLQLKSMSCTYGHCQPQPIPRAVNLFVKASDFCNARCAFCSNQVGNTNNKVFNHVKLWKVIDELREKSIIINRINITGGEPSVALETVNKILFIASTEQYQNIHLHLNTNGLLFASKEMMRHPRWNSISISLHHYNRNKLSEIYGVEIPETALDFKGIDLERVNASCNLIRRYIDNPVEIEKMMKFAISLRLHRLGFVALMKVNNYCNERYVDFDEIDFNCIPHLYFTGSRNRGVNCKCSNYLYNHRGKILEVYMRNYSNPNYCESSLLYDGQFLRQGFQNDNIIY